MRRRGNPEIPPQASRRSVMVEILADLLSTLRVAKIRSSEQVIRGLPSMHPTPNP